MKIFIYAGKVRGLQKALREQQVLISYLLQKYQKTA
jgi:hypothetical protein